MQKKILKCKEAKAKNHNITLDANIFNDYVYLLHYTYRTHVPCGLKAGQIARSHYFQFLFM